MKFTSIEELVQNVSINAKALDGLGRSGALESISNLNELESAEYAKALLDYKRKYLHYLERLEKWNESSKTRLEAYQKDIDSRREKNNEKQRIFDEKYKEYEEKVQKIKELNENNKLIGKAEKKIPEPPKLPKFLIIPPEPSPPPEPDKPANPDRPKIFLSVRDRVKLQKEMLNFFLTGHPLDGIPIDKETIFVSSLKEIAESGNGEEISVQLVMLLTSIKQSTTRKSNAKMAKLRFEDKTGSVDVVAFPRLWKDIETEVEEDIIYRVFGKLNVYEMTTPSGEDKKHISVIGLKIEKLLTGCKFDWEIVIPLLKGKLKITPLMDGIEREEITNLISKRMHEAIIESSTNC